VKRQAKCILVSILLFSLFSRAMKKKEQGKEKILPTKISPPISIRFADRVGFH